jgi:long-chain acyl-CoA synthetase
MAQTIENLNLYLSKPWLKFYADYTPKEEIEIPNKPLFSILDESAEKYPNRTAIIFLGKEISYKKLKEDVDRFANALQSLGVKKGDVVSLLLPNTPHFVISYYAILKIGAIVSPISPLYKPPEIEHQLKDSGAETIIILDLLYKNFEEIKDKTKVKRVIVADIRDYLSGIKKLLYPLKMKPPKIEFKEGIYKFIELLKYSPDYKKVEINPKEDAAAYMYTGGTTGLPKAAKLSHYNILSNLYQIDTWIKKQEEPHRILAILPFFHIYGQTVCLNFGIYRGSTLILMPRPDIKALFENVSKYKVDVLPGVPTLYIQIINSPLVKKYDIKSIRYCISGAAALPVEVLKKFESLTGGKLREGYGLTEASPVTHCNPLEGIYKEGSIGIPIPNTLAAIAHPEENRFLGIDEIGELVVSGPQVMMGYHNRPEENEKIFFEYNGIRWLRTGDMAKMDKDGFFYIVDRKKEIIKYKGYSVYPREIEELLYAHEAVKEAAVLGIPDPEVGEKIKAYIVLKDEYKGKVKEEDIINYLKDKLAPYKLPKIVEFKDNLPKSMVGKILKRVLLEEELKKKA